MEQINRILNAPIIDFGETHLTLLQILSVLMFIVLGSLLVIWSGKFLRTRLSRGRLNADAVQLVSRAYLILGMLVLAFMVLEYLNVPLAAFAFISGAIAIGVGFGAQNIISNFISGWILMWERPIKIGDFLELNDLRGTVEAINTRSTRIRRADGVHMLVPNSFLLENTVTNWTLVDDIVRTSVTVGVAYGSDVEKVRTLLNQVADDLPDVLDEPAHSVFFEDFGDSALIFTLDVWVSAKAERGLRIIRSDLRFRIDDAFAANDVVIAFPQRDVHLDGSVLVHSGNSGRDTS